MFTRLNDPAEGGPLTHQSGFAMRLVIAALFSLVLAACGDSDAPVVASDDDTMQPGDPAGDPPPEQGGDPDDDHDGEDGDFHIETAGRLAIQEADVASVRIVELDTKAVIANIPTTNPVSSLSASPDRRYAVAIQRTDDMVEFVDGGLWQEDHTDHLHDYREDPVGVDYRLEDVLSLMMGWLTTMSMQVSQSSAMLAS
jgi:hypothetical protein